MKPSDRITKIIAEIVSIQYDPDCSEAIKDRLEEMLIMAAWCRNLQIDCEENQ